MLQSGFESFYDPALVEVVHINTNNDSASELHDHWDPYNPTFPVLVGCQSTYSQYGDGYIPYNVVIDPNGVLRYSDSGFNQTALHNVISQYISLTTPSLQVESLDVCSDDNMDGRPDAGETAEFCVTVVNNPVAVPATSVTVTLSCTDPDVSIPSPVQNLGVMNPGQSINTLFTIQVDLELEPHQATFELQFVSQYAGGSQQQSHTWTQSLGRPAILVVDGDGTSDGNESFMTQGLQNLNRPYDLWDSIEMGSLPAAEAQSYEMILWLGGVATLDLDATSRASLDLFMEQAGMLFMSHQFAGDSPVTETWLLERFGVVIDEAYLSGTFLASGAAGHPQFDMTDLVLTGVAGANNNYAPDRLIAEGSAESIFSWTQGEGGTAATSLQSGSSLRLFCGFPIEATRTYGALPNSVDMTGFLTKLFEFYEATLAPLPAPGDLVVAYGEGQVFLEWSPVPGAAGYMVYKSNDPYSFEGATTYEVLPTSLEIPVVDTQNFFQVRTLR